ncbi:hypothetical protein J7K91_01880 [bacterium]|nr:hypothetical protein [bacterium]
MTTSSKNKKQKKKSTNKKASLKKKKKRVSKKQTTKKQSRRVGKSSKKKSVKRAKGDKKIKKKNKRLKEKKKKQKSKKKAFKSKKKIKIKKKKISKKKKAKRVSKKSKKTKKPGKKKAKKKVVKRSKKIIEPLEELFGSPVKLQLMKLFFRNQEKQFLFKDIFKALRTEKQTTKKYLKKLEKIGLIRKRKLSPRKQIFYLNPDFEFFNELKELILKSSPVSKEKMLKQIKRLGKIKLVLLSGLFVGSKTARADLLIVGDNLNQRKISTFIKKIETEAGTEINCATMSTDEFNYRYDMYDRFVRDLLEEKNELLINHLGL